MIPDNGYAVAVAAIGAVPVIVGSVLAYKAAIQKQIIEAENKGMRKELDLVSTTLGSFGGILAEFSQVEQEIQELCANSEITRVVLLCAWNGKYTPKWTTSVWQYRTSYEQGRLSRPVGYVHVGLDSDYAARLVEIKRCGSSIYRTESSPDSLIKKIYEADGVVESLWVFLSSSETQRDDGRLITYMSFASQKGRIENSTRIKCELLAARLAPLTGKIGSDDDD